MLLFESNDMHIDVENPPSHHLEKILLAKNRQNFLYH